MLTSPFPQSWRELVYLLIGTLISLIPQAVSSYRNRKKSDLEEREVEARAVLAQAEARSIQIRDDLATGAEVGKMLSTMMEAADQLRDMHQRVIKAEADAHVAQLFVDQLNAAARLTVCEHHPQGVRLSDYLPRQLNPPVR